MDSYKGVKIKDVKGSHERSLYSRSVWKGCLKEQEKAKGGEAWEKYKDSVKQHRACYEKETEKKLSDKKNQKVLSKFREKLERRYRQGKNSR